MGLNFTAIDFETANSSRASVCAVGLTKVRAGKIVETLSWLVAPPAEVSEFDPQNVRVHGIKAKQVIGAPSWQDSHRKVMEVVGDYPAVAFFASFDASVFRHASVMDDAYPERLDWRCAWELSKEHLDLDSYKLPDVASALKLRGLKHHDAGSDAEMCARIVLEIADQAGVSSVDELWPNASKPVSRRAPIPQQVFTGEAYTKKGELPETNTAADPSNVLFGERVTITGFFEHLSQKSAIDLSSNLGAFHELNLTRKTTVLVICGDDPHTPGFDLANGTGKQKKALQYMEQYGQEIRLMSEAEFYEAIGMDADGNFVWDEEDEPIELAAPAPVVASESSSYELEDAMEASSAITGSMCGATSESSTSVMPASDDAPQAPPVLPAPPAATSPLSIESEARPSAASATRQERRPSKAASGLRAVLAVVLFVVAALFLVTMIGLFTEAEIPAAIFSLVVTIAAGYGGFALLRANKKAQQK